MVLQFANMLVSAALLGIPTAFSILMMALIRFWMAQHPVRKREIPQYSLDVMKERAPKHVQRMVLEGQAMPIGMCHTYGINVSHSTLNLANVGRKDSAMTPPVARATYRPSQPLYSAGSLNTSYDSRSKFI